MGLLLSRSNSHGENNSAQSAFYTNRNLNCQTVSVKRSLQTIVFTMRIIYLFIYLFKDSYNVQGREQ